MELRRLAKNYYVAKQGVIYGYGTDVKESIRSVWRQLQVDQAMDEELIRNGIINTAIDNFPEGYNNEGGYLTDPAL